MGKRLLLTVANCTNAVAFSKQVPVYCTLNLVKRGTVWLVFIHSKGTGLTFLASVRTLGRSPV